MKIRPVIRSPTLNLDCLPIPTVTNTLMNDFRGVTLESCDNFSQICAALRMMGLTLMYQCLFSRAMPVKSSPPVHQGSSVSQPQRAFCNLISGCAQLSLLELLAISAYIFIFSLMAGNFFKSLKYALCLLISHHLSFSFSITRAYF